MGKLGGSDVMWTFSAVSALPGSRYGIKLGLLDLVKLDIDHRSQENKTAFTGLSQN